MHTQTHMNTHISLQRELLLPGDPVPSTTSAGTWHWMQPSAQGWVALALEQLLDVHGRVCEAGRGSAVRLLLRAGPQGITGLVTPWAGDTMGLMTP